MSGCQPPNYRTVTASHLFMGNAAYEAPVNVRFFVAIGGKADMAFCTANVRF